jgi:hypothetical protein
LGATLRIAGSEYDVEKDIAWEELILIEELSGVPLGTETAFQSLAVIGACVFVITRRTESDLTWEEFVKRPMDITDERDEPAATAPANRASKRAAKRRPPKPAA